MDPFVNHHCFRGIFVTFASATLAWIAGRAHATAFMLCLECDKGNPFRDRLEIERLCHAAKRADFMAILVQILLTVCIYVGLQHRVSGWRARGLLAIASLAGGIVLTMFMALLSWDTQSQVTIWTDQLLHKIVWPR